MQLPEIAIRRPVFASVLSLLILLVGFVSFNGLSVREYPRIDEPTVTVSTTFGGASSEVIESQVTKVLEDSLAGIEGVDIITSISRQEQSQITVRFSLARDPDSAAADVRDKVSRVRQKLPDDVDEPTIAKVEADATPVIWLALNSDTVSQLQLSDLANRLIKPRLQTAPGAADVGVEGVLIEPGGGVVDPGHRRIRQFARRQAGGIVRRRARRRRRASRPPRPSPVSRRTGRRGAFPETRPGNSRQPVRPGRRPAAQGGTPADRRGARISHARNRLRLHSTPNKKAGGTSRRLYSFRRWRGNSPPNHSASTGFSSLTGTAAVRCRPNSSSSSTTPAAPKAQCWPTRNTVASPPAITTTRTGMESGARK